MFIYASHDREVIPMVDRARNLGQIVMGLNRAQQSLTLLINQALANDNLNMTRLTVLSQFSSRPNRSLTVSTITTTTGLNQPTVTKTVAALIEQNWLVHQSDPSDGRKKVLKITPNGMGAVIRAYGKITPLLIERFGQFDDRQVSQLLENIELLNSNLGR